MRKSLLTSKPATVNTLTLSEVELKALRILVENRMVETSSIKDIKGLCRVHDKLEEALKIFLPTV